MFAPNPIEVAKGMASAEPTHLVTGSEGGTQEGRSTGRWLYPG